MKDQSTKVVGELTTNGIVDSLMFVGYVSLVALCVIAIFSVYEYAVVVFSKEEE